MKKNKLYRPSNGTEGEAFIYNWCRNCIHGKYEHDQEADSCDIVCRSFAFDVDDPEYPKEWTYNDQGDAVCTAFVKWDWNNDGDPDDPENPKAPVPEDPNQLCLPFVLEEIERNIKVVPQRHYA